MSIAPPNPISGQAGKTLRDRIVAGEDLFGSFVKTPSPILVEVLATCDLDVICLDAEHAPFDRLSLDACIMAARAASLPVFVRTATSAPEHILQALDCGADGVVLPHIRSAEEAHAAAKSARFGAGGRGYAGSTRAAGYGLSNITSHQANSAARTVVIAQIEDLEALDEIDRIAAVEGVDMLFVGRIDLTVALGATSPDAPEVVSAVDRILAAAHVNQRPIGMFVPRDEDVVHWRDKGASLFLQGSDHAFMRAGARAARAAAGF